MKQPLLLISGLMSNHLLWRHQTSHLGDIASIHLASPSQETPEQMVQSILAQAPPAFALAGHSMGGWLCLELMRAAPARITRLCLLNTTARPDTEEKKNRRLQFIKQTQEGHFPTIAKEIADHFVHNPKVKRDVLQMFLQVGPEKFIHQEKAMLARKETFSVLPAISCPTLIIHGANDANFSLEESQELQSSIKQSKLAIVEHTGHMTPMEAPQAATSLLHHWLKK